MSAPIRIAVLGGGHLGRIHIQQLTQLPEWQVVGFHDPHPEKCAALEKEFGVPAYANVGTLLDKVEVLDIVTPTVTHASLATQALDRGLHLFIEKPVTETVAEADSLLALAERTGRMVQVGHVERFNPAFQAALPYLADPMFIEAHRLAQFNPRGTDVSVVLDLMIHDIDLVLHVVKSPVVSIHASGVPVVSTTPDITNARIAFANGCVANLTASRISMKNMRKSRFFQHDAYIAVDLLDKSAEVVRMRTVTGEPDPFAVTIDLGEGKGIREISFEKPEVSPVNAIREELRAFAASIRSGTPPAVPLKDGAEALRVAHAILEQIAKNTPV
ncbi:MAG: Gfo/Idh/MocA family oxidoreductase [Flavobacteriales bacterium]|jgi:predicted dehydrogenase|nr:Gfo/Idh/MocA family oxidoreductase [Flavobacteriales bacterium]